MTDLEQAIRAHQGADEPTELEYYPYRGLIISAAALMAWAAFVAAGYAGYLAVEALLGA